MIAHWYFLLALLFAVGIAMLVWCFFMFRNGRTWIKGSKVTYGRIISIIRGHGDVNGIKDSRVEAEYEVENVKYTTFVGYTPLMRKGMKIKIHYMPQDPVNAKYIKPERHFMSSIFIFGIICLCLCAFISWSIFFR